ncbi:histidine kinase [Actinoplanes sp. NBC_00393]|uniref:sensor histidine kinase n=1 Tax=Actinoplanes sp. NBC_00393 TaxID=2975953 RepID=UPI002E1A7240
MASRRRIDASIVLLALAVSAGYVALVPGNRVANFLFLTLVLSCAGLLLRVVVDAVRRAADEHRTARALLATPVDVAARQAVARERVRLAADIEAVIRAAVSRMAGHTRTAARQWDDDPDPPLAKLQADGRAAVTELRRLLGLLREAESAATEDPPPRQPRRRPSAGDLALAAGAAALSVAEHFPAGPDVPASMQTAPSIALTAATAATLALRRSAPAAGAAACGAGFLLGFLTGWPISPGLWILMGPAWLAWSAMARWRPSGCLATALLLTGITLDLGRYNRVNLPMCLVLVGAAAVGGAVFGRSGRRQSAAHSTVLRRTAELGAAAEQAVLGERLAVARDVHDVVSHAVAVLVTQSGAAQALRRTDPPRARAALAVVEQTAADTLSELDRMVAGIGAGAVEHDDADLRALVGRMTGAGLRISFDLHGPVRGRTGAVVYRITQEALTNVVRHAPGARVTITVQAVDDRTTVEITDDGPGPGRTSLRGYGLTGLAERVESTGGRLSTGPGPGGAGFRVAATLPGAAS